MAMSAAGRQRISEAQKKRWAALRAANKSGRKAGGGKKRAVRGAAGKRARRSKAGRNPYMAMTIQELVIAKQQIDEAWTAAAAFFSK